MITGGPIFDPLNFQLEITVAETNELLKNREKNARGEHRVVPAGNLGWKVHGSV